MHQALVHDATRPTVDAVIPKLNRARQTHDGVGEVGQLEGAHGVAGVEGLQPKQQELIS